ncbi:Core-2/I-Branching enzyme [Ancylostoma ceylanicum]|uniref:Core-2/I-Branching enzyme n=1 Tax=Ancylostoma ceylanicum TaxID=53326 RepID=A0A0D6LAI8_9BILA|nr:Core-2/I-Branching enzyme [Ancylostoma ceylanicum]
MSLMVFTHTVIFESPNGPDNVSPSTKQIRCRAIEQLFGFNKKIVTPNELQYPLAYGAVVYKNLIQVLFMLSAFYRPHNEYCVAVSGSANKIFKFFMAQLGKCFSNIHVMNRPSISWGSFEIINSTWACAELLSRSRTKWMYYQQLAGVDVPLKTNLEMVEILKKWNNTVNSEFATFQPERLGEKQIQNSPLPLFKSSLSAAVPRNAIDKLVETNKGWELLHFLNGTDIPDEAFWTTLTGSVKGEYAQDKARQMLLVGCTTLLSSVEQSVPGGTNAEEWMKFRDSYEETNSNDVERYRSTRKSAATMNYYLARHQVWYDDCGGKISSGSCVYGVYDIVNVLKQPHLIAHKMYLDFEPAAFFCVLKYKLDHFTSREFVQ